MSDEIVLEHLMRLQLIDSYGVKFEDIFCRLMMKYNKDFIKIKPYGNIGDRKNDGYIKGTGEFFQVYGPEENISSAIQAANKKIDEDFVKLKEHCDNGHWECLKKWNFVYNDKGLGQSPILAQKAQEISENHNIPCRILGIDELVNIFEELPLSDKRRLVNFGRIENISNPNLEIFQKIFHHFKNKIEITEIKLSFFLENYEIDPDLEKKIKLNNLSSEKAKELYICSNFVYKFDEFLAIDPESANYGKDQFVKLYNEAKENENTSSDEIYDYIVEYIYPKTQLTMQDIEVYNTHIKIMMAKYFEVCDIFEAVPL